MNATPTMALLQRILSFIVFTCFLYKTSFSSNLNEDKLLQGHQLTKTNRLISSSGWYTFSFFQVNDSQGFYLGTRRSSDDNSYFWIANRDTPIHDPSFLTIDQLGNLKIVSNSSRNSTFTLYSSQADQSTNNKSTISAILEGTGSFVLREMNQDGSVKRVLWQSFDHLTNVLIPSMRLGFDTKTGQNWSLTSWRSDKSPSSGSFTLGIDPKTKQLVMWWRGNIVWNSGPWNNKGSFTNLKSSVYENDFVFNYTSDEYATYVTYLPIGYIKIGSSGSIYSDVSRAFYSCINGDDYFLNGCSMPSPPKCRDDDSLYLGNLSKYGVMSSKGFRFHKSENLSNFDCWMKCLNNCTCEAYSYTNKDGTGCVIWSKDSAKFVATNHSEARGRDIYFIRRKKSNAKIWIISAIVGTLGLIILCFTCNKLWRKLKVKVENRRERTKLLCEIRGNTAISIAYNEIREQNKDGRTSDDNTHIFDFQTILEATENFSSTNKIGKGGFGPVYKGKLPSGQEIAIKRLSKSSGQGLIEFKNEAMLIVKLQHTNLVRLLGFCIDREERILVYEYFPNKSLNLYLFDSIRKSILEWKIRCKIIEGVAQGLVYLHQYSRVKVIHRDLKASNILLDNELNPKISDFGTARIFGLTECEEQTNRIVGTYGYMSPEYAMMGVISTKTDVYSFGILLLEILSGKKNNIDYPFNLVVHAWNLWNEGEALNLMDTTLDGSYAPTQVLRYIHIGLLCTQDQAKDRPTMLEVVSFLSNEFAHLPPPKQPTFCITGEFDVTKETEQHNSCSINETTNSLTSGR